MKKYLFILGCLNAVFFAVRSALSYFLVTAVPFGFSEEREREFFVDLAEKLSFLGPEFQHLISGNSIFQTESYFVIGAVVPIFLSSIVFISLLIFLFKYRENLDDETPRIIFRWSIIFVCVGALAFPMLTQDFWLSIAWGRMTAAGVNPYHTDLTVEFARNLPLNYFGGRMTYGPLWALVSGILAFVSGGNALIEAILFKLILIGSLIGSLFLIWRLLEKYSLFYQCIGLATVGWLPITMTEIAGDGHNDIVMVFLLLLWLYLLERGKVLPASLALAASVLIKYISAPLFILEILYLYFSRKDSPRAYLMPLLASGALMLLVFGLFYRSPGFFDAASAMRDWHFLTPRDAVLTVSRLTGLPKQLNYLPQLFFAVLALYQTFLYIKEKSNEAFRQAVLAVLSAILYTVLGHIWPWFLLWVLAFSALVPRSGLARWNIGVALAFPFAMIAVQFIDAPDLWRWNLPGLFIFIFALAWQILTSHIFIPRQPPIP